MKTKIISLLLLGLCALSSSLNAKEIGSWNQIKFKSNPAVNLHHFIFEVARTGNDITEQGWQDSLTQQEQAQLRELVAYYKSNFIGKRRSAMRTMPWLQNVSRSLTQYQDGMRIQLENKKHLELFKQAFPIYKSKLWQTHDEYNKAWLSDLLVKLNKYGLKIQTRLEDRFEAPLFAANEHPVDIVYFAGHRNGAFTHEWPYTMINSSRSDYQGYASLEMIFHEVTHAHAESNLSKTITSEFNKLGLEQNRNIWHPIQFYIVGKTTEEVLANNGIKYTQYATNTIFKRGYFSKFTPTVMKYWHGYPTAKNASLKEVVIGMAQGMSEKAKSKNTL
ncbi:hypothetical protein D5018_09720 [Parashewanella curva]|uniref:DUF2268 domain-containing protein n=1 Tax=Parashewanella curva TaxID=2338552 RepID=A0A3L8PZI8_9GAMM|nr:hypothetical protein [Parashewanella curva]RLV59948.1 hypothetical protein D5018_09720 [Parashewanella curva]